jgi:hypothetical protein
MMRKRDEKCKVTFRIHYIESVTSYFTNDCRITYLCF